MLFDIFFKKDINKWVEEQKLKEGSVLLDVRTREEYNDYHIEGSINIPLDRIFDAEKKIPDKNTAIYVHCLSGARSAQAKRILTSMGYDNVENIGGISSYTGKIVR